MVLTESHPSDTLNHRAYSRTQVYSQVAKNTNPSLLGRVDPRETVRIPFVGVLTPYRTKSAVERSMTQMKETGGSNGPVVTGQRSHDLLPSFDRNRVYFFACGSNDGFGQRKDVILERVTLQIEDDGMEAQRFLKVQSVNRYEHWGQRQLLHTLIAFITVVIESRSSMENLSSPRARTVCRVALISARILAW